MATSAAWLSKLVKQGDFRIHNDILFSFFFFFFCLPPGSKFGTGLSVKHEINLVWPKQPCYCYNFVHDFIIFGQSVLLAIIVWQY